MQSYKYTSFFTLCLGLLLVFTSCTKEENIIEVTPIELTAAEFLARHVTQDIVFQYSYHNPHTGVSNGWLIDKKGEIKTYDLSDVNNAVIIADKGECEKSDLLNLYAYAKSNGEVIEAEEMVAHFKQIKTAALGGLTPNLRGTGKEGNHAFYAIVHNTSIAGYESAGGCGGECGNEYGGNDDDYVPYIRIVLEQSGTDNRYNESTSAIELVDWLSALHETISL